MRKKDKRREEASPERKRITPLDVQQIVFRRALLRGYNEQEVDGFLDKVTEEIAVLLEEQRRLRDQGAGHGVTVPIEDTEEAVDAVRTADDIVARAREDAERIVREAEQRAAVIAAGSGPAAPGEGAAVGQFIRQERAFLEDVARTVQRHAETVRDMARARRAVMEEERETVTPPMEEPVSVPESPVFQAPEQEREPIQSPAAVPGEVAGTEAVQEEDKKSLKELFWGED
jgi:DivIVA domain-containing protein